MREDKIRGLLENLIKNSEGNYNRKLLGMRSMDEYLIEKESLIEETINQIYNQDIINKINKLIEDLK